MPQAFRSLKLFAALVALGLMSAPAPAATYQFTAPFDVTFHVTGADSLPAQAFFNLSFTGTPRVFDPLDRIGSAADFFVSATVEVLDGNGNIVPQVPSSNLGNNLSIFNANCAPVYCTISFAGFAPFSSVIVAAIDQIIHVTGGPGFSQGYTNFSAILTATVPDNLVPTPLPAALPLFGGVLLAGAWVARRRQTSFP